MFRLATPAARTPACSTATRLALLSTSAKLRLQLATPCSKRTAHGPRQAHPFQINRQSHRTLILPRTIVTTLHHAAVQSYSLVYCRGLCLSVVKAFPSFHSVIPSLRFQSCLQLPSGSALETNYCPVTANYLSCASFETKRIGYGEPALMDMNTSQSLRIRRSRRTQPVRITVP